MIEVKMKSRDGIILKTAGKKVEENIKVTPTFVDEGGGNFEELFTYNGEYESLGPIVSGQWYFNKTLAMSEQIEKWENVSFNIDYNGVSTNFKRIWLMADSNTFLSGDVDLNGDPDYEFYYDGWVDEAYRLIDFGEIPQSVSQEFFDWLNANAIRGGAVQGVWLFNDSVNYSVAGPITEKVRFVSNGVTYEQLYCPTRYLAYSRTYLENINLIGADGPIAYYIDENRWTDLNFREINFTSRQEISSDFWKWLVTNATKKGD